MRNKKQNETSKSKVAKTKGANRAPKGNQHKKRDQRGAKRKPKGAKTKPTGHQEGPKWTPEQRIEGEGTKWEPRGSRIGAQMVLVTEKSRR